MTVGQSAKRIVLLQLEEEGESGGDREKGGRIQSAIPSARPVLRAPKAVALDVRVPQYETPAATVVTPVRSYAPGPGAPKRDRGGVRPVREKFSVADELAASRMQLAVKKAFDIEARMSSVKVGSGGSAWPFQVLFDRNTDYAPGSVVLRPSRPSAAEIQFRDDVADLLILLAKEDVLAAKLVAYRALRVEWDDLRKLDPARRQRWTLDKIRRRGLLRLARLDAQTEGRVMVRTEQV
jgi:hypothetical protein